MDLDEQRRDRLIATGLGLATVGALVAAAWLGWWITWSVLT